MTTATITDGVQRSLSLTQVLIQPNVGISFFSSFFFLGIYFYYFMNHHHHCREKQISWLLTLASSVTCTSVSFFHFFFGGGGGGKDSIVDTSLVCFFITYLIMDLGLGVIYYRPRLTLLTGWLHHLIYFMILTWFLQWQVCSFFTLHAIVELPTMILAVGVLYPPWRCDWLFAILFFLLRIVYHLVVIYRLLCCTHHSHYHRLVHLWIVALLILPLHLYWFHAIVCGLLKRYYHPLK